MAPSQLTREQNWAVLLMSSFPRYTECHVARSDPPLLASFSDSNFNFPAMTSRISIARPTSGGYPPPYQPDSPSFSGPSAGFREANPDDSIQKLQTLAKQVEDNVEIYSQPLKPHLPAIGRFLIVVTFLEDSLRIVTQWGDQLWYLQRYVLLWHHLWYSTS